MSNSKARILANLLSDGQITVTEISNAASQADLAQVQSDLANLQQNAITEGDTSVTVVDNGAGGKVVVRVDNADAAEIGSGGIVVPKGTTAERDPAAPLGSIRYNTDIGFFETLTSSGWGSIATPPSITSITPSSFNGEAGGSFTVGGAFFDAGTTAVFVGADGTQYPAGTVTFIEPAIITVTNSTNLPVSNEPFRIEVTNSAGLSTTSVASIDAGSVPSFNTPAGSIGTTSTWNEPISVTVSASDAENTISGYSLVTGSLPSGVTLDGSTGTISGTSTEQATTTYTFTIGATDSAGNTNTRQFSITVTNAPPAWNSPAENETFNLNTSSSANIPLSATDPEGSNVSYSSSNLPSGLVISGSSITGTTSSVESNNVVSVSASDGFNSSVRTFNINILLQRYFDTSNYYVQGTNNPTGLQRNVRINNVNDTYGATGYRGNVYSTMNNVIYAWDVSASSQYTTYNISSRGTRSLAMCGRTLLYLDVDASSPNTNTIYYHHMSANGQSSEASGSFTTPYSLNGLVTCGNPNMFAAISGTDFIVFFVGSSQVASGHVSSVSDWVFLNVQDGINGNANALDASYNGGSGFFDTYNGILYSNRWNDGAGFALVSSYTGDIPSLRTATSSSDVSGSIAVDGYLTDDSGVGPNTSIGMGADVVDGYMYFVYHGDGSAYRLPIPRTNLSAFGATYI